MKVELLLAIEFNLAPQQILKTYIQPTNTLLWSSEGARVVTGERNLAKPSLNLDLKGNFLNTFTLPKKFKMQEVEKGQEIMEL
jgi:hypothetical protein